MIGRQLGAGRRPLLVDVPVTAGGPSSETRLPGLEPRPLEPGTVFVAPEAGKIYLSVPVRNVGGGLAVIDGAGVTLTGDRVGGIEYRTVQREHVPEGETTRIDLIAAYPRGADPAAQESTMGGAAWQLTVSYSDVGGGQPAVARFQIVCQGDGIAGSWLVDHVEHEGPGARMTLPADLPDLSPPGRTEAPKERRGVRGEQVVDLWGNPVRPRRRNR